jgi:ribosomal-protein-alanine N-acetyltransferase
LLPLLRPVCLSDVVDLHRNCFPEQPLERTEDYLRWCVAQVARGRMARLVAEVEGQVVGNGQLSIRRGKGEIGSLVVAPSYQQRGIGGALLGALVDEARRRGLVEVEIAANAAAPWIRAWYERRGFSFVEERTLPRDERVAVLRMVLPPRERGAEARRSQGAKDC